MKAFQTIVAMALTIIINIQCDAQKFIGHIDSVKMIPSYPSMNDTLNIIFYNSFPSGGCHNKQRYFSENLPYISNISKYCIGPYAFPCSDQDTIRILPLVPGAYTLDYKIETAYNILGCDPYNPADSIDVQITVNYPESIKRIPGSKNIFKIINDPNFDKLLLYLNHDSENYTVIIQNILGKEIYRSTLYYLKNEIFYYWKDGIYLVTVFNDNEKQTQKVIIKNNH